MGLCFSSSSEGSTSGVSERNRISASALVNKRPEPGSGGTCASSAVACVIGVTRQRVPPVEKFKPDIGRLSEVVFGKWWRWRELNALAQPLELLTHEFTQGVTTLIGVLFAQQ